MSVAETAVSLGVGRLADKVVDTLMGVATGTLSSNTDGPAAEAAWTPFGGAGAAWTVGAGGLRNWADDVCLKSQKIDSFIYDS